MYKQILILLSFLFILVIPGYSQETNTNDKEVKNFATLTVAVVNSHRPFHIAFIKYYDSKGDIILNTSEEFRVEISKSPRFRSGSIRKTIPVYPDAHTIEVTVSSCTNMHENIYLVSDLAASNNEITFVFQGMFEEKVSVEFDGIQKDKPCTFVIKGANTNSFFYADYSNAKKDLPSEAKIKDIDVTVSETSLYMYKITSIEKDKKTNIVKVVVELSAEESEKGNPTGGGASSGGGTKKK